VYFLGDQTPDMLLCTGSPVTVPQFHSLNETPARGAFAPLKVRVGMPQLAN